MQRQIAVGLGVDFAELTGNGDGTISAVARQSMLRTREMYKDRQRTVAALVLNRLYYAWLHSFLRLSVSGEWEDDADFTRLGDHEFQGRRWGWIEPTAEVNAAVVAVAHGWRSDAEIAAEYGNDIDDNIREAARIDSAKAEAGLITIGNGLGSSSAVQDQQSLGVLDKEDGGNGAEAEEPAAELEDANTSEVKS